MPTRLSILPLLMAILVAMSSIGAPIMVHECLMSGSRSISFEVNKSCCCGISAQKEASTDNGCCSTKVELQSVDTKIPSPVKATLGVLPVLLLLFKFEWPDAQTLSGNGSAILNFDRFPTPPSGRSLLMSIGTLLL